MCASSRGWRAGIETYAGHSLHPPVVLACWRRRSNNDARTGQHERIHGRLAGPHDECPIWKEARQEPLAAELAGEPVAPRYCGKNADFQQVVAPFGEGRTTNPWPVIDQP